MQIRSMPFATSGIDKQIEEQENIDQSKGRNGPDRQSIEMHRNKEINLGEIV